MSKKKVSLMKRIWNDKEIEQLITSYEAWKCLWNICCVNYMNRDAIELAYSEAEEDLKVYMIACTGKDTRDMSLDCSLHV